ncbi:MAG: ABC transporter ATP-binding protein [bacterium]
MIHLENVSRNYLDGDREIQALANVSLNIPRGETVALSGRSGSGKSTLLHLMGGLEGPSSGTVTVEGNRLNDMPDRALTAFRLRHIGFIFQFFHLIPTLTVLQNLMLPAELAGMTRAAGRSRALSLLEAVSLADRSQTMPDRLSGGEQQRVAVSRSLMLDPTVVLADEPTGNLDSESGARVLEMLWDMTRSRGSTLVIATHSAEVAGRAARSIEMRDGRIVRDTGSKSSPSGHGADLP